MVDGGYGSGYNPGPQKVLCKVVQTASATSGGYGEKALALGQLVLLKLYDPLFWHLKVPLLENYFKVTVRAYKAQSVEVGAYSHLFRAGLTGFPQLAPQFHGCWTIAVHSTDPEYAGQVRHVVALAIDKGSIQDLSPLRGNPPAGVIVDDSGMVSPFSEYLEKKRLEEINPGEEAKPEEETAPAEEIL
ncbi:hypothetical protein CGCVW01_v011116 [Colletotrichum viniferum]|nr:hypothetical protein CGCVW01_v011116 [Colletotrichum viniferum]